MITASKDNGAILAEVLSAQAPELADNHAARLTKLEVVLKRDPEHAVARNAAAWAAWRLGRFEDAAEHWSRVRGPKAEMAALWRAHALAAAGEDRAAQRLYEVAAREHFEVAWYPSCLPGEEAEKNAAKVTLHWRRACKEAPRSAVRAWLLGNALAVEERWSEAREAYESALALDGKFDAAQIAWAIAALRTGDAESARGRLEALLAEQPGHRAARHAACCVEWETHDPQRAVPHFKLYLADQGRRAEIGMLVRAAESADSVGDIDFAIDCLGRVARFGTGVRSILGKDDLSVLRRYQSRDPKSPVERYAFASALYGELWNVVQNSDFLTIGAMMRPIEAVNQLNREDLARQRQLQQQSEQAIGRFDSQAGLQGMAAAQVIPHIGRVVRELRLALATRPDFIAAEVLLAEVLNDDDQVEAGLAHLRSALAREADAPAIRRRLADRVPLEQALELLEGAQAEEAAEVRIAGRLAHLTHQAGDICGAAERSLAITRRDAAYWDAAELVAFEVARRGDRELAVDILDAACRDGRSSQGALLRATLRLELGRPGVTEALIDAWRSATRGSTEEARARELLRQANGSGHVCGRCGGSGQVSVTEGSTGQYGSIRTVQEWCPQCLGLGLWHAGVH